jgi:hypothetical protein
MMMVRNSTAWELGPAQVVRRRKRIDGMTKSELIVELAAANPPLTRHDVQRIVGTAFRQISAALARGNRVGMRGSTGRGCSSALLQPEKRR